MVAPAALENFSAPAAAAPRVADRSEARTRWLLLAALLLLVRKTDAFLNPQFWAEDFWPFFVEAKTIGPQVVGWPYNGYLHVLPRLIAALAAPLHASIQPAAYFLASLAVTLLVVARVLSPRIELPAKPWLALAIVAVPHTGEVFLNVTNLQWIVALGLVALLFQREPETVGEWTADIGWLVVAGLTGPFGVMLLPVFVVRAWRRGSRAAWVVAGVLAVPAIVQAWHLRQAAGFPDPGPWHFVRLCDRLSFRWLMTLALGTHGTANCSPAWRVSVGAVLLAGLVCLAVRRSAWRETKLTLLAVLMVLVLAAIGRARPDTWAPDDALNGDRYLYLPKVLTLWLLAVGLAECRAGWPRALGGALVLFACGANLPEFRFKPLPDLRWASFSDRIQAGERVDAVPINPGWKIAYPGRPPQ